MFSLCKNNANFGIKETQKNNFDVNIVGYSTVLARMLHASGIVGCDLCKSSAYRIWGTPTPEGFWSQIKICQRFHLVNMSQLLFLKMLPILVFVFVMS